MRALEVTNCLVMPGHWSGMGPVLISQTDAWTSNRPDQRKVALIDLKVIYIYIYVLHTPGSARWLIAVGAYASGSGSIGFRLVYC